MPTPEVLEIATITLSILALIVSTLSCRVTRRRAQRAEKLAQQCEDTANVTANRLVEVKAYARAIDTKLIKLEAIRDELRRAR